jgi:hypothetical protein
MGNNLKVEPIRDHPKRGRVRVPEKIVSYVSGSVKKTRDGTANTMRSTLRLQDKKKNKDGNKKKPLKTGGGRNNNNNNNKPTKKKTFIKLLDADQAEFDRALRKGYLTLQSTGYRNGRKGSALACAHREWCDEQEKPQIVLCKASGGRPLDALIVDLSPLRVIGDEFLLHHTIEIFTAATSAGMELRKEVEGDGNDENEEGTIVCSESEDGTFECVMTVSQHDDAASKHISKLPVLSLGIFEGERSQAKAMSRELARLWDIQLQQEKQQQESKSSSSATSTNTKHHKRDATHRRRQRRDLNSRDLSSYL